MKSNSQGKKPNSNIIILVVLILTSWTLLYKLDAMPMYLWDESRQANNALEMSESNNFLYPTYNGQPDFWNTKPHLLIAVQALFFKLMGPGLLALRLPSAIAGILTALLWFQFFYKRKKIREGLVMVFVLLTCGGFNTYHITRTGDYDALLLLFFSLSILKFYQVLFEENSAKNVRRFYMYWALAFLTKSLAAAIWLPVFVLLAVVFRKKNGVTIRSFFPGIWILPVVVMVYYGYREIITPGYWNAVWENEVAVRYFAPNEGHVSEWYYYFVEIYKNYFSWYWLMFLIAGVGYVVMIFRRNTAALNVEDKTPELGFFVLAALLFLCVISTSRTRIHWYMAPAIPLMAASIAILTGQLWNANKKVVINVFLAAIAVVGVMDWFQYWKENLHIEGVQPQVVFRDAERTSHFRFQGTWLLGSYDPLEDYYGKVFARRKIPFHTTHSLHFQKGDTVYFHRQEQGDSLHKYNNLHQIHSPDENLPVWVFVMDGARLVGR